MRRYHKPIEFYSPSSLTETCEDCGATRVRGISRYGRDKYLVQRFTPWFLRSAGKFVPYCTGKERV